MNILITTGIYPPDVGGPAKFVPLITDKLSEENNVSVITLSENIVNKEKSLFEVKRINRKQNRLIRFIKTFFLIIKLGKNSDIIFINGLWLETFLANLFIKKKTIRKFVGDPVWEKYYSQYKINDGFDEFQNKKYNITIEFYKYIRNLSLKSINTVVVPSSHLLNFVESTGFTGNLIEINNGTTISNVDKKNYDKNRFLIVSRLVRQKNIDLVIKSFDVLRNKYSLEFNLQIIGTGPEYENIKTLIENLNLNDSINLVGTKFGEELETYYKNSNYLLQISSYEGMSHTILEAMNHGLVVITSKFGGNYELIGKNKLGYLVEPIEVDQIVNTINYVIKDNEKKVKALEGKHLVNKDYNIMLTSKKYAEMITNSD